MSLGMCVAAGLTMFCVLSLLGSAWLLRPSQGARRMVELVRSNRPDRRTVGTAEALRERALSAVKNLRARLGLAENARLKKRLDEAGLRSHRAHELFYLVQCLLPIAGAAAALLIEHTLLFWIVALPLLGYLLPGMWLKRRTTARRERIRRSIPDALDLLGICVEAGLGLDQALLRIAAELTVSHPDINEELTQVNLEQRAGKARLEAWGSLAERTQIDEFKAFVSMLMQTDRFGTPIVKALNSFSEELRLKRSQRAEEAAAKTKIKIIFPLVLCIFPCVFIVLLAPAVMSIGSGLGSMTQ